MIRVSKSSYLRRIDAVVQEHEKRRIPQRGTHTSATQGSGHLDQQIQYIPVQFYLCCHISSLVEYSAHNGWTLSHGGASQADVSDTRISIESLTTSISNGRSQCGSGAGSRDDHKL